MKSPSAAFATHITLETTSMATCWKVKRAAPDNTILGFTDNVADVSIDIADGDGLITYLAATGYSRTAIANSSSFDIDNLDLEGVLESEALKKADMLAGIYDNAEIKIFMVNHKDLTMGPLKLRRGHIGELKLRDDMFVGELRGLVQKYSQEIGELVVPECRSDLYDTGAGPAAGCRVRDDPPTWTATTAYTVREARDASTGSVVKPTAFNDRHFRTTTAGTSGATEPAWNTTVGGTTSDGSVVWTTERALTILNSTINVVTDEANFTIVYTGDAPDAELVGGRVEFTSGANSGFGVKSKQVIKKWTLSTNAVELLHPMPFNVTDGDALLLKFGCIKTLARCKDFDNIENFRGEPHVPGNDLLFRTTPPS